jgi:ribosomal protein S18 acetylase RimI-like enzyme
VTAIRQARGDDAPVLAALCGELGYPATSRQLAARLAALGSAPAQCVFVAGDEAGAVVGWLHVALQTGLLDDAVAEILGLVVAESARGAGIGGELLRAAEAWARERGAATMRVRSRSDRERAHRFYRRAGYLRTKTQDVFARPLGG